MESTRLSSWTRKCVLFRNMSGQQVRTALLEKLLTVDDIVDYKLLKCSGQQLMHALDQLPSGSDIIDSAMKRKVISHMPSLF